MSHLSVIPVADIAETGALGVVYLKRLWSLWVSHRSSPPEDMVRDRRATHVLFSGLGLGLEETLRHVGSHQPSFAAFEEWILGRNGGSIEPLVVARLNAALTGAPPPAEIRRQLEAIDAAPPVLSAEDLAHWAEHGWVVVHDAISPEACRATADAIWQAQGMAADRPDAWGLGPLQQCVFVQMFRHPALDANRRSARIHKACAQLWGTADLWTSTDRVGFNPPESCGVPFQGPGIHWDVSLKQPIPLGIQGLIYLTDTTADQGAFALVPGMHRTVGDWLETLPAGVNPNHHAARTLTMTPIAGRAGDLILWHHALPHGPTPNLSDRPRLVHYLTMFPADFGYQAEWL